jgi:hypothetical protein
MARWEELGSPLASAYDDTVTALWECLEDKR